MSNCQCGERMVPTDISNSGTTRVARACWTLFVGNPDWRPWKEAEAGHSYVIEAKPSHPASCCTIEPELRTT
jgi:hypothetical protein